MNKTRWIIFAVICIGIFAAIVITSKNGSPSTTFKGDATKIITQGPIADRVFGSTAGKVTLIEYGDFECPACGAMYPTVSAIKNAYKDELTFIFRDFPLTTIHPNALAASTAAEAAGQQGKFYEMFDQLYQNQSTWGDTDSATRDKDFDQYAQSIGLNMSKYHQDLSSSAVADKINRDRATGANFGVDGTPTFVLDGKVLSSDVGTSQTALQQAILTELSKAGFKVNQ